MFVSGGSASLTTANVYDFSCVNTADVWLSFYVDQNNLVVDVTARFGAQISFLHSASGNVGSGITTRSSQVIDIIACFSDVGSALSTL